MSIRNPTTPASFFNMKFFTVILMIHNKNHCSIIIFSTAFPVGRSTWWEDDGLQKVDVMLNAVLTNSCVLGQVV